MSGPDERQQATALWIAAIAFCLWLSHEIAGLWPLLPGTVDLKPWLKFWNKPIIVNWPTALALLLVINLLGKHIRRKMTVAGLRRQQEEAMWLKKHKKHLCQSKEASNEYELIE